MPGRINPPPTPDMPTNGNHEPDPSDEDPELDQNDSDIESDSDNSEMMQVDSQEFPSYFNEIDGRLYHSNSTAPYPLPVDTPEQQRLTMVHDLLRQFIGANYVGPVAEVLAPEPDSDRRRMCLDICTGTGRWVIEMVEEFPHVQFRGFDIVPIATRYPPRNVQFELEDANLNTFRWSDGTFDLVNARFVVMAVRDYRRMLGETARLLRPGGLFISYEWGAYPLFDPNHPSYGNLDPSVYAPASCRLFDAINAALETLHQLHPIASRIPLFLQRLGGGIFSNIVRREQYVPIGPWHGDALMRSIGATCLEAQIRYADSVKPLLISAGWPPNDVLDMERDYVQEIRTVRGLVSVLYTVHATRA